MSVVGAAPTSRRFLPSCHPRRAAPFDSRATNDVHSIARVAVQRRLTTICFLLAARWVEQRKAFTPVFAGYAKSIAAACVALERTLIQCFAPEKQAASARPVSRSADASLGR